MQTIKDKKSSEQNLDLTARPRRLRKNKTLRNLISETILCPSQFIAPIFIHEGKTPEIGIKSMPGIYQMSLDRTLKYIEELIHNDIKSIILFGIPDIKDSLASGAWAEHGIIQKANRKIKENFPEILLVNDTCLCEYMDHGHCGTIVGSVERRADRNETIDNDETLEILQKTAISQAESGADIIAPSGMMDGMVSAIRKALDENNFSNTAIMSYAVKYSSAFYGPFREAAESTPQFGDRKTYQMDFRNKKEAIKETLIDEQEGADIIMVKPALAYLDIISEVKAKTNLPIAAYNVSGEYSMIKAAAQNGWIDEESMIYETLTGIKRAGADIIISYFANDVKRIVKTVET